jgi:hypothetical protein
LRLLKIFKKKPLTRLELKSHSKGSKFRLRGSRTSGINAAVHPLRGITLNTKHGLRASKTFKGLTLGFQRSNSIVRGRWSSLSSKSKYGTFNFTNPNRSSFKFGGIQLRGKNAKGLAFISTVFTLIPFLIKTILMLPVMAIRILVGIFYVLEFFGKLSINILIFFFRVVQVLYEVLLLIIVDIPKQIISNIAQRNDFDSMHTKKLESNNEVLYEESSINNNENVIIESTEALDHEIIEDLKSRLASYKSPYDEIHFSEKFFKTLVAIIGFLLILIGMLILCMVFIPSPSSTIGSMLIFALSGIILILFGRFITKPFFKLRQQKIDEKSKKILGI